MRRLLGVAKPRCSGCRKAPRPRRLNLWPYMYSALTHAVEEGAGPVLVHYDSVPAIRSLLQDPLRDNICLPTAIQVRMAEIERAGRGIHLNWLPSHAEVEGNEAADHAAYEATLLPIVTHPISMSISLLKRSVAAAAMAGISRELREAREAGSPLAFWTDTATYTGKRHSPLNIPRRDSNDIHRLRLGYKCASLLDPDNPTPAQCPHCQEEVLQPLFHYLLDCEATRQFTRNLVGLSAPALVSSMTDQELLILDRQFAPPY